MPRGKTKPETLPMPDAWKQDFRSATLRTSFMLTMTQPMVQFLSGVADGVQWDRWGFSCIHAPANDIATASALQKRGLIIRKTAAQIESVSSEMKANNYDKLIHGEWNHYSLTPAGAAVVELLKVTGIFVVSDAALNKKSRKA
jgi:hypothetical protein